MLGKRKNRSKASKASLSSPDKKKSRDEVKVHSTASETDEVFEGLEMEEGARTKLQAVLKKLEKLDTIESRLSQMHTTLASIEAVKCKQAGFGSRRCQNKVQTAWLNS